MPLSQEEMRRLDAIFAKRTSTGLPGTVPIDISTIPSDSSGIAALKGFTSGASGELADLAAHLAGSDIMEQYPNNLLPYQAGDLVGSLVGAPARLGAMATRLVGKRLLPTARPITQSVVAGALGNAPLGTINALGQDEDPLTSTINAAVLGGG